MNDKLNVVLGCFGRSNNGFVSCRGCENVILTLSPRVMRFNDILDYFESCRLPERAMMEAQAIRHFLYNMQNNYDQYMKKIWKECDYNMYQMFLKEHEKCGLYLKLDIPDETTQYNNKIEEKSVFIKASNQELSKPQLRVVK